VSSDRTFGCFRKLSSFAYHWPRRSFMIEQLFPVLSPPPDPRLALGVPFQSAPDGRLMVRTMHESLSQFFLSSVLSRGIPPFPSRSPLHPSVPSLSAGFPFFLRRAFPPSDEQSSPASAASIVAPPFSVRLSPSRETWFSVASRFPSTLFFPKIRVLLPHESGRRSLANVSPLPLWTPHQNSFPDATFQCRLDPLV